MDKNKDTIYALSTPSGKSAIAVIRISGNKAFNYIKKMSLNMPTTPNKSKLNKIKAIDGTIIDQTITTYFKAPRSYTGENMVEVSLHGSGAVIKKFIDSFKEFKDVRLANPGEFTRRSFENNKLDLTQIEAIADLVNSETELQRKQAYSQLEGGLSLKTQQIYDKLKIVLANIEAAIDFSDEDLPKNLIKKTKEQIQNIIKEIDKFLKKGRGGEKIRNGFIVGIVGKPNTGKSSFINNISNKEIAIVTDQPGTTRDIIESYIDLKGVPVRFFDTAGITKSKNVVEIIGINKAKNLSKNADLNLIFIENISELKYFNKVNNPLFVQSKYDCRKKPIKKYNVVNISSKTSYGIEKLLNMIFKNLSQNHISENINISRERHESCLKNTKKHLEKSKENKNYDLLAEDIKNSIYEISKIHGNVDIEDILDIIFNDFCIGK